MGRGVSRPSGAFAVAYDEIRDFGYRDEDDEGNKLAEKVYDEALASMDWDDYIDDLKDKAKKLFPSMRECDKWLDREDHAIMENAFAWFGVSEYCGCVCMWLATKSGDDYGDEQAGLRAHWQEQVQQKFRDSFGTLVKLGTFSNGESVYKRKEAAK